MKYSKIFLVGEKLHYSCAPELPPKDDGGNFCLTLLLYDVSVWQKTVKRYPIRKEDISKFSIWVSENTIYTQPIKQLSSLDGVDIPFSEIQIIEVQELTCDGLVDTEYATLKVV